MQARRRTPSVPHPFAFFLAKGWETTTADGTCHEERSEGSALKIDRLTREVSSLRSVATKDRRLFFVGVPQSLTFGEQFLFSWSWVRIAPSIVQRQPDKGFNKAAI